MTSESGKFLHRWVFPNDHLVQRIAVSADELIVCFREDQVAHLRAGVDAVELLEADGVPEPDALVSSATSGCQEASVQWAPVDSLDGRLVIRELLEWFVTGRRPYE